MPIEDLKTANDVDAENRELRQRIAELEGELAARRKNDEVHHRIAFAVEQSSEGLAVWDRQGRFQFVNYAFARMHGYSPEELVGRQISTCYPEDEMRMLATIRERLQRVEHYNGRVEHLRNDGTSFPGQQHFTPYRDEEGEVVGFVATLRDLSEQDYTDEQLYESRELFRTLSEQSVAGIMIVRGGRVEYANQTFSEIVGHSVSEIRSWPPEGYLELVHPDDRAMVRKQARQRARGENRGHVNRYACRLLTRSGEEKWIDLYSKTLRYDGRQAILTTVVDITEKMRAEEEQESLRAKLEHVQRMEAVGRLTAGIAHDFNNLLTVINGFTELARLELDGEHPVQDALRRSLDSGRRASELVRKLLAFSRKDVAEEKVLCLDDVVSDTESMLRRIITENVQLETQLCGGSWRVEVDPIQTEQVITNLVVNARDAMPEGGKIVIATAETSLSEDLHADTGVAAAGDYVTLVVEDEGRGIDPEVRPHIFEPFFTTKQGDRGTGLGLFMVYGVVTTSRGHIAVESRAEKGTRLTIYLPRSAREPESETGRHEAAALPSRGEAILLVEDDPQVREFARRVLSRHGYEVREASDGETALDMAFADPDEIELLITDVVMPGLSGKALAEKLHNRRPELKTLFISGYNEEIISQHGLDRAKADLLQKPFNSAKLLAKVRSLLDAE